MPVTSGPPFLCDLSEARFDTVGNEELVMPHVYRAPEVILGMPWSYPVDIWGFAMTGRISSREKTKQQVLTARNSSGRY
jgi:hypothetical protein